MAACSRSFSFVGLAAAVLLLVVVRFAPPAQCRRGLLLDVDDQVGSAAAAMRRYPRHNATTTTTTAAAGYSTAAASGDGRTSKFTVIFCVTMLCNGRDCYCCETGDYCYYTRKQCQANCDVCNPRCPPAPGLPRPRQ